MKCADSKQDSLTPFQEAFWIGQTLVEPSLNQITSNGETRQVEHLAMQVLLYLSAHPDQLVSREAILDVVWADTTPNDEGLTQAICKLRKALGDRPGEANVIQTIRKKGYRLIAPISVVAPVKSARFVNFAPHPDYPGKQSIRVRIHGEWLVAVALFSLTLWVIAQAADALL